MHSCACRTSALRIFVRNISQIQVPVDTATRRFSQWSSRGHLSRLQTRGYPGLERATAGGATTGASSPRGIHTTCARNDAPYSEGSAPVAKKEGTIESELTATDMPTNLHFIPFDEATARDEELDASFDELDISEVQNPPSLDFIPTRGSIPDALLDDIVEKSKTFGAAPPRTAKKTRTMTPARAEAQMQDAAPKKKERWTEEQKAERKAIREAKKGAAAEGKGKQEQNSANPGRSYQPERKFKPRETWQEQKAALKEKFPDGWAPRKRLSPDALAGIRALHKEFPKEYSTPVLADKFQVSPEVIRRILRSKWEPTPEEEEDREQRWFRRGKKVWAHNAELGMKPPRKWRAEGIVRDPSWHERPSRQPDFKLDKPVDPEIRARWEREKRAKREQAIRDLENSLM